MSDDDHGPECLDCHRPDEYCDCPHCPDCNARLDENGECMDDCGQSGLDFNV